MNANISSIFKAYDVRGKVGSELTIDVAEKIGKALADWLPEKGAIAVGRDMRPDSVLRLNAEAKTQSELAAIVKKVTAIITGEQS